MAGRAGRDQGVARLVPQHHVHGPDRAADPAPRGPEGTGRHEGVAVKLCQPLSGFRFADMRDMALRVRELQVRVGGLGRGNTRQGLAVERRQKPFQPRHALGVAGRRDVGQAVVMRDQGGGHGNLRLSGGA